MTNLIILALSLTPSQREMTITYFSPRAGTIYVDTRCAGDSWWNSGAANQPISSARTNSITIRNFCGEWGMIRLRLGQ